MKHVRLIRHGESAANAGEASLDHASIPLTPKGVEQACLVAGTFVQAPDLIVASPFSRAQATAMQTVAAFPSVPFEIWPIQEFTYLEPARCINTSVAHRRDWVEAYWAKADPTFADGEGAESFLDFISRAQSLLDRLAEHPCFIKALRWPLGQGAPGSRRNDHPHPGCSRCSNHQVRWPTARGSAGKGPADG